MNVEIVEVGKIFLGFRAGNLVEHPDLGIGIVVGFSSISSEPCVFFYSREKEKPYCVGWESLSLLD